MEREFEMLFNGELQVFTVEFDYDAWTDCYDSSDYRSEFIDWEYTLNDLYYTDKEGHEIPVHYDLLRPEYKDLVESEINAAIENELL